MKNRKFRGDRLFKIVKVIVNIVMVFTLLFGIFGILRLEEMNLRYFDKFDKCVSEGGTMNICGIYLDMMNDNERLTYLYLKIGLGLPIVFYGGLKLHNHLFPKTDEEK